MRDVLVVGGGIIGCFVALECQARGMAVTLIDAGIARPCASWAGGGILSPLFPWRYDAAWRPLVKDSGLRYRRWQDVLEQEVGLSPEINACGMLVRERAFERASQWADAEQVRMLAAHESGLAKVFTDAAQVWMPDIAAVRNSRWISALARLCQARGIRVVSATADAVREREGGVEVHVGAEVFRAGKGVIAAGHWSKALLASQSTAEPLMPVKGEMLLYQLKPGEIPAILLADSGYLIPREDGLVLAGSTLEAGVEDMRPAQPSHESLTAMAATWYPPLADVQPVAQWAGVRPGTRRALPFIGMLESCRHLCLATGHFRNGLVSAPATGQLVAEMLSGASTFCDPAPYSPSS